MNKIGIIGGGNLGSALAEGLVNSKNYSIDDVIISKRNPSTLSQLMGKGYRVIADNKTAIEQSNIIVLAILPQQFNHVVEEIAPYLTKNHLLISVVSGVTIADVEAIVPGTPVLRAMPNTAIAIRESMTCISSNKTSQQYEGIVEHLFNCVGTSMVINEELMTSATALCACGIAFFLRAIRAASQGGTQIGFHADEALKMAAQTAKGAAALLVEHGKHPEREIDKVTSPEGCTIAGLNEMEHKGFSSALIKGIITSSEKAEKLY
ncbi:pyrroline-5-carboxylate reductase [Flavobacteriales bacterium]|jgi:pyrroline-5-carboxylate reductase|nr:pyrroline-5-carboxylate reductase [Flavobacteriales bacterium]